ncbi:DUF5009 domain-containing protein [Bythopirellula goksoeyrii]|nr:DUF5009 domain-containing protein [Bythopirellula goksoeyrii]
MEKRSLQEPDDFGKTHERMLSLDAFRGFVIGSMLLVNMTWNESVFPQQFFHVPWNDPQQGATFADLVFPWFLFIAGASIPFSIASRRRRGISHTGIVVSAAKRAVTLYLLGVLLTVAGSAYTQPLSWNNLLQWNILQLIGAAYFIAVCIWCLPSCWRIGFVVLILAIRWITMMVPSWEAASALAETRAPTDAPMGPHTWAHFDALRQIYSFEHLKPSYWKTFFSWFGASQEYLPGAAIAVLGGLTSSFLATNRTFRGASRVVLTGSTIVLVSFLLQYDYVPTGGGILGDFTIPFSKWFFSPAYCLLAAGTAMLLFVGFFVVIDLYHWTTAWWLRVWGMNALALYVAAEVTFKMVLTKWLVRLPDGESDSLAAGFLAWTEHATGSAAVAGWSFVLSWLAIWWLACWWFYRRGIFIRV